MDVKFYSMHSMRFQPLVRNEECLCGAQFLMRRDFSNQRQSRKIYTLLCGASQLVAPHRHSFLIPDFQHCLSLFKYPVQRRRGNAEEQQEAGQAPFQFIQFSIDPPFHGLLPFLRNQLRRGYTPVPFQINVPFSGSVVKKRVTSANCGLSS